MPFSENGGGIYFTTKENCGLECWIQNMEDGGIWMRLERARQNLYGGKTLVPSVIRLGRGVGLKAK